MSQASISRHVSARARSALSRCCKGSTLQSRPDLPQGESSRGFVTSTSTIAHSTLLHDCPFSSSATVPVLESRMLTSPFRWASARFIGREPISQAQRNAETGEEAKKIDLAPHKLWRRANQVRNLSAGPSAAKKPETIRVPAPVYGVAGKYASALYISAVQANALDTVYEELQQLVKAAEKSPTFQEFLKDLSVSNKDKVKAVQALLKELEFSQPTINFLALLAENRRLHGLKEIFTCLSELMMAHRKQVKATVTSVVGLPPKELEELKKSLKRFIKPDETIIMDQKIDKRIMGGFVVDLADKHIDLSIATRLKKMENVLMEPLP